MKTHLKKSIINFISLLFILIMFSSHALAMYEFDESKDVLFTIDLKHEGMVLPNVSFNIYKVADVDQKGNISILDEFKEYPIDFEKLNLDTWNEYALTLKGYILKDKVEPILQAKTNEDGIVDVSLKPGLYLVIGNQTSIGNHIYKTSPFFTLLPGYEKEVGKWNYEVTSFPKSSEEEKQLIKKKITKIWKDSGNKESRPKSIEVEVFKNGKSYQVINLNKGNNWKYILSDLDNDSDWTIVEKDIKGGNYKVLIKEDGHSFIIENTYIGTNTPKTPSKPLKELPNTGQSWWPVFTLVGIGILFILLGLLLNNRRESK